MKNYKVRQKVVIVNNYEAYYDKNWLGQGKIYEIKFLHEHSQYPIEIADKGEFEWVTKESALPIVDVKEANAVVPIESLNTGKRQFIKGEIYSITDKNIDTKEIFINSLPIGAEGNTKDNFLIQGASDYSDSFVLVYTEKLNNKPENQDDENIKSFDSSEIDEDIRELISLFNKKGLKTKFSCSSHEGGNREFYIMFDDEVDYLKLLDWHRDFTKANVHRAGSLTLNNWFRWNRTEYVSNWVLRYLKTDKASKERLFLDIETSLKLIE